MLQRIPRLARRVLALSALSVVAGACIVMEPFSTNEDANPTVHLQTGGDGELGVSTEYGVVFLGRGKRSGPVEFTSWFGDGPSFEGGIIESLGGGLYVTRAEIVLPVAHPVFDVPIVAGTDVVVRGRLDRDSYSIHAVVTEDEGIEGILLEPSDALEDLPASQHGAGVYVRVEGELRLVGLLSGRVDLGGGRSYFTVVGPDELWRVVAHRRDAGQPRPPVYRGDIVP